MAKIAGKNIQFKYVEKNIKRLENFEKKNKPPKLSLKEKKSCSSQKT